MSNERNQNPDDASKARTGGATPMSVSEHTYKITKVPAGCQDYAKGDTLDLYVNDPPPPTITINNGDDCDGTEAELVS